VETNGLSTAAEGRVQGAWTVAAAMVNVEAGEGSEIGRLSGTVSVGSDISKSSSSDSFNADVRVGWFRRIKDSA
jgi:hypothetical protein